jgi:hypothetical protein
LKRARRSLDTGADLDEFTRGKVDALLLYLASLSLYFSEMVLAVGTIPQRRELGRHLPHLLSEFGQLPGDGCYVFVGCDPVAILRLSRG